VAKARRFAETQEAVKPKKAVRILEAPKRDHNAESVQVGTQNLQPLLDGFQQVIQTVLQSNTQPSVGCAETKDKQSKGDVNLVRRNVMNVWSHLPQVMEVEAPLATDTSSNDPLAMAIGRIALVQGLISIMGIDVRATDEAHPQHQAEDFRIAKVTVEDGAIAHTKKGKGGLQTLATGTMTSVPGPGTAVPNAMGRPGTSGTIATTVEVETEVMTTGDVGTTNKDSTNSKVRTNSKVGTNHRAKGKVVTHLQVNIRIKVSTNRVRNRDRHHKTRNKTKELDIKDKATIKVKVAILISRE